MNLESEILFELIKPVLLAVGIGWLVFSDKIAAVNQGMRRRWSGIELDRLASTLELDRVDSALVGRVAETDVIVDMRQDGVVRVQTATGIWLPDNVTIARRPSPREPVAELSPVPVPSFQLLHEYQPPMPGLSSYAQSLTMPTAPEREQLTGDREFDSHVSITGDGALLGALGAKLRKSLRDSLPGDIVIARGRLTAELLAARVTRDDLEDVVERMVTLSRKLDSGPSDLRARLAANAVNDPVAQVRNASLRALTGVYTRDEATADVCRTALQDADADVAVRLRAASHLGQEGVDELMRIASSTTVADALRVEALSRSLSVAPDRVAPRLLAILSGAGSPALLAAALTAATTRGIEGAHERLVTHLSTCRVDDIAELAELVGPEHGAVAVAGMLERLDGAPADDRVQVIRAIGHVGAASAIGPLLALNQSAFVDVRDAAEAAANRIRERLGPESAGRLSASDGSAGGLTVAAPTGQLSRPDGDDEC